MVCISYHRFTVHLGNRGLPRTCRMKAECIVSFSLCDRLEASNRANRLSPSHFGKTERKYKFVLITSVKNTCKFKKIETSRTIRSKYSLFEIFIRSIEINTIMFYFFYFSIFNIWIHLKLESPIICIINKKVNIIENGFCKSNPKALNVFIITN